MRFVIFIALLSSVIAHSVFAQNIEAKGHAVITEDGLVKARAMAIQDALQQATLMAGAKVESTSTVNETALESSSVRVRSMGMVHDMVILDEWVKEDDDLYVVLIRARVEDLDPNDERVSEDQRYRRKIAVTQFQVSDRRQIHDLPNIEINLARNLAGRLQQQQFYTIDASDYLLPESMEPEIGLGATEENIIIDLANRLGVQFVLTGIIHDMGVTKHPLWVQFRHPEVEVLVLDGVSGTLVSRHKGNLTVREGRPFDFPTTTPNSGDKFFASPVGEAVNKILGNLAAAVASDLQQLPFTARVIQARGKKIQIDIGSLSKIKVGDKLMAYTVATDPVVNVFGQSFFGYKEEASTTLTVKHVQPQFSIGELENDKAKLKAGDIVRFIQ